MKPDAKYKHLDDDSKITGIGSLFRGVDRKLWSINLDFAGKKSKSIQFSAVPLLARRRILNPTSRNERKGLPLKLTVSNARNWQQAILNECPAYQKAPKGKDFNQFCFVVEESERTIYIPQLEIARVLFYHDPFLARLSLQHNALAEDFIVDLNDKQPTIYVREGAEYPLYHFNRDDNRRFLSWVLMDNDARQSFESISANLLTNQVHRGNYDHWDFHFTPPSLTGVELEMSGWNDFDSKTFFVWEIHKLDHLSSSISREVDFVHPKYERQVGGKTTHGEGTKAELPEQFELDDNELSDTDKATISLMSDKVKISFKNPFITNRIAKKTRSVNSFTGDGGAEVLGKDLSANEKEVTGSLPGGFWNNLDDQSDDAHLYLSKFQSFLDMVNLLESVHGCQIRDKTTVKLPKLGDGKKHWLTDTQNPRCLAIVQLIYDGHPVTLLEIDTSDGAAKLSTMMMETGQEGWAMANIDQIKLGIMKKSLGWPTQFFKQILTEDAFSGIPHPKSKHSGLLAPDEIAPWAQRFAIWIKRVTVR